MPLAQESFRAPVDVVTLVFAAASGRVIEMSTVSVGFGADGAAVVSLQLVRVLLAVAIAGIATSRLESSGGQPGGCRRVAVVSFVQLIRMGIMVAVVFIFVALSCGER